MRISDTAFVISMSQALVGAVMVMLALGKPSGIEPSSSGSL
jgi:hypothetical protein